MEYFKRGDLLKLHKNKKTLIGGYKVTTDNDDDTFNDLVIPGFFYNVKHNDSLSSTIIDF